MKGMLCQLRVRGANLPTLAAIALYGLVLLAGPALHHDFLCHQNSRTHCTSCVSSQFASGVESETLPASASRWSAGLFELRQMRVADPCLAQTTGRSPPA